MQQDRMNYIMTLRIHKDKTDNLELVKIANDFVSERNDHACIYLASSRTQTKCGISYAYYTHG